MPARIRSRRLSGVPAILVAAGLVLGAATQPAAAQQAEPQAQIQVEVQDEARVQVQAQGAANVRVQVWVNGVPLVPASPPTTQPTAVKADLRVKQERNGGPATFTFALPETAAGALFAAPEVSTWFGPVKVVPGSVTTGGCRFTWDVPSARKQAPLLRGTEMRVEWQLACQASKGQPPPAPTAYTTVAYVTITKDGAVAIADVETRPVVVQGPFADNGAPMPVYRYSFAATDFSLTAVRYPQSKSTTLTVRLKGGNRLVAQPDVKATVGSLGARGKWNPNRFNTYDSVNWMPPKELPKKPVEGTVTWTWTSQEPATGEEKAWTLTLKVKVDAAGNLTITKTESTSKVTKAGRPVGA